MKSGSSATGFKNKLSLLPKISLNKDIRFKKSQGYKNLVITPDQWIESFINK